MSTTIERTVPSRDDAPRTPASPSEMEARMSRHSITPGRLAVLDLADYDGAATGRDRTVALGAIVTGLAAAIGLAVGLG
ncbi:MAG: hypothetical protein ACTHXO_05305 [Actinomycetaceae bacterium]